VIVCPRCSKENQDHYKFCLGCGAELPRDAEQPKSFSAPTPPGGTPAVAGGGAPPPPAPPVGGPPAAAPPPAAASPAPAPASAPGSPPPAANPGGPPPAVGGPPPPAGPPAAPNPAGPPAAAAAPSPAAPSPVAPSPVAPSPVAPSPAAPPPAAPSPPSGGFGGPSPAPSGGNGAPAPAAPAPATGGTVVCPKCGTSNNVSFKFCGSCGQPLQEAAAAAAPAQAAPAAAPAAAGGASGTLVLIRPDGTEGESIPVDGSTVLGRETVPQFASDSYLSPRHASFHFDGGGLTVKDEGSLNGIYLRILPDDPIELADGAIFRVGQEIIRYEQLPEPRRTDAGVEPMGSPREGLVGRICLLTGRETHGNCYAVPAEGLHLGRERGDILFPDDGYVSGLHARIHADGGRVFLTDVGSSNGSFIRVEGQTAVASGNMLLMGQQLFRIEY